MKKYLPMGAVLLVLNACSPEAPRHVQPVASDVAAASEVAASEVAVAASHLAASPVNVSASPAAAASPVNTAASGVVQAASAASTPAAPDDSKLHKTKKVPIGGSEEFGNTTFYFPASIKKEGKLFYVMTENRFARVQKLPESGKPFLYSLIREAVDCELKLTDPVAVTHFSEKDEVVEKHTFPYPDYKSWSELELQSLADEHPDRAFIDAVCQNGKKK